MIDPSGHPGTSAPVDLRSVPAIETAPLVGRLLRNLAQRAIAGSMSMIEALGLGQAPVDLRSVPSDEIKPLVGRLSRSALALKGAPPGLAATRALMTSLHQVGLDGHHDGVDCAGLILALAFQCSQVQGSRGDGIDIAALAWARAEVVSAARSTRQPSSGSR